jgi:hypothetical protein
VLRNLREEILIGTPKGTGIGRSSSVCRKKNIIKMYHEERAVTVRNELKWLRIKSCCAQGNEIYSSTKREKFIDQLNDCQLLELPAADSLKVNCLIYMRTSICQNAELMFSL